MRGKYLRIRAANIAAAKPWFRSTTVTPGGQTVVRAVVGTAMTGDSVEPAMTFTRLCSSSIPATTITTSADWMAAGTWPPQQQSKPSLAMIIPTKGLYASPLLQWVCSASPLCVRLQQEKTKNPGVRASCLRSPHLI